MNWLIKLKKQKRKKNTKKFELKFINAYSDENDA